MYTFGDGLSYSQFVYHDLTLSKQAISPDESLDVTVKITNPSKINGYETAMLFVKDRFGSVVTPDIALKDFTKIFIKAGETVTFGFTVGFHHLKLLDRNMQETVEKGMFDIFVGGNTKNTLKAELQVR